MAAAMMLAGLSCSSAPAATPAPAPSPAPAGAWKLVWSDIFSGPAGSSIDPTKWKFDTGQGAFFGTGEVETMTASPYNARLDGHGHLDLVVLGHGAPGTPGYAWTSARLQTVSSGFAAPPGGEMKVTASIEQPGVPHGLGYWPGFWMLGPQAWPMDGEIDIMEDVNGLSKDSGTLHCGNLTQRNPDGTFGPCREKYGLGSGLRTCAGCQQGFHTYTVIIDRRDAARQQIRWYLDGQQFFSVSEHQVGEKAWTAAVDHGFSILLSLQMGGAFPDAQCQCTTPTNQTSSQGTMAVQYVDVYTN